ncbi:hypothetical protein J3A83DRAFT_1156165 [Scleroderma citrinum]
MFIPLVSSPWKLHERRKGGSGGHSSSGSEGENSGGTSSKGSTSSEGSGSTNNGGKEASVPLTGSSASGKSIIIPSGQLFAGRSAGGGTRDQILGSKVYGSGYPDITGRGVAGRGFPFWYWPMVWAVEAAKKQAYLNGTEYGDSYNASRPGGPLMEAIWISNASDPRTTFRALSDNNTVISLIDTIASNCSSHLSSSSSTSPSPFNASDPNATQPEQAIQYYRACSVVLTLDGYNNSATYSSNETTIDSLLPSNIDTQLLGCLNQTIALAVPLVDGAIPTSFPVLGIPALVLLGIMISWITSLV